LAGNAALELALGTRPEPWLDADEYEWRGPGREAKGEKVEGKDSIYDATDEDWVGTAKRLHSSKQRREGKRHLVTHMWALATFVIVQSPSTVNRLFRF